jgi:hypothetical protein
MQDYNFTFEYIPGETNIVADLLSRRQDLNEGVSAEKQIMLPVSPSGHGVASFPNWVLYSHAGPVGTAEDLSSQTTKSSDHVKDQVIQITCKVT